MKAGAIMKATAIAIACAPVVGCLGPAFKTAGPPPEGKALVYFMRNDLRTGGAGWNTGFAVNGVEVVSMQDHRYSWIYLQPGEYLFCSYQKNLGFMKDQVLTFKLQVSAGATYYLGLSSQQSLENRHEFLTAYMPMDEMSGTLSLKDDLYDVADPVVIPQKSTSDDGC